MMLGFLSGSIGTDRIVEPVFYILETLDWFESILRFVDGTTALSKTTGILVVEMQTMSSDLRAPFSNGVSCIRLRGDVPAGSRVFRTLFGEPRPNPDLLCNPAKAIHYDSGYRCWESLPDERLIPFQSIQTLMPNSSRAGDQLIETITLIRPSSAHIVPEGLVYRFHREESHLRNSPVLGWDKIRKAVTLRKPNTKQPKKQTVLVESNPGLTIGGPHG